jgi:hypothetical protein
MKIQKIPFLEFDKKNIFDEQKKALEYIFNTLDLSKIGFVGGVADYINLREFYQMPVNDIDIIYENDDDIMAVENEMKLEKFYTNFYQLTSTEVLVSEFKIEDKNVHFDYYKRNFNNLRLKQSYLLGKMVWHISFKEMQSLHNSMVPQLTSEAMGVGYDWKRLYKHSKKASLYNNITYLKEKELILK